MNNVKKYITIILYTVDFTDVEKNLENVCIK